MQWASDKNHNVLFKGLKGEKVKKLQTILKEVGLFNIVIDGYFGDQTTKFVKLFKDKMDIPGRNGKINIEDLMNCILELNNKSAHNNIIPPMIPPREVGRISRFDIEDIVDKLPKSNNIPKRYLNKLEGIFIHHSSTNTKLKGSNPFGYANFHVNYKGWPSIAYNYVIQPQNETIYKTLPLNKKGYHVHGYNARYIGICVSGDYDIENPTEEIYNAICDAINFIISDFKTNTNIRNRENWVPKIKFHRDVANKNCPGLNIKKEKIKEILKEEDIKVII